MQMVPSRGLAFLGILVFFGPTAWGQNNTTAPQLQTIEVAATTTNDFSGSGYSSNKAESATSPTPASADLELFPPAGTMVAAPVIVTAPISQPKPSGSTDENNSRNKKIWFSLAMIEHGAAGFDAWSTRQSVNRGG